MERFKLAKIRLKDFIMSNKNTLMIVPIHKKREFIRLEPRIPINNSNAHFHSAKSNIPPKLPCVSISNQNIQKGTN